MTTLKLASSAALVLLAWPCVALAQVPAPAAPPPPADGVPRPSQPEPAAPAEPPPAAEAAPPAPPTASEAPATRAAETPAAGAANSEAPAQSAELGGLPEGEADAGFEPIEESGFPGEDSASKLDIYGFADFGYFHVLNSRDSTWAIVYRDQGTFFVGHLNLYLSAELSEQWRSMIEVRFSYLPHGNETVDPATGASQRVDTKVTDYAEYDKVTNWGSIIIERAWLEYAPLDIFSVRGGQFLTPYGFWNEDHGSPVIIPIQRPQVLGAALFPERQTGLEAHLRTPIDDSTVGVFLTLSNGRGPVDAYRDLDGNKAVGGRAYLSTRLLGDLDIGASFYKGRYTDSYEQSRVDLSGPTPVLEADVIPTVRFDELSLSGELRFRYEDLLVQSEIMMNEVAFDDDFRPVSVGADATFNTVPDYRRWGMYALAGYRTPLLGVMPYFMYTFNSFTDQELLGPGRGYAFGLNMRPSPSVVLKVEYVLAKFDDPGSAGIASEPLHMFSTQAAWAF